MKLNPVHKPLPKDKDNWREFKITMIGRRLQYVLWRWVKGNGMFNSSFRGHRAIVFNYFKICVVDIWFLATQCHDFT